MKKYTHYGVSVQKLYLDEDTSFREYLKKQKLEYTDLPLLETDVLRFVKDGCNKYAVIKTLPMGGQEVYITERIPDDLDFQKLIDDVDRQVFHPEEKMVMESKIHRIFSEAIAKAKEQYNENQSNDFAEFNLFGHEPTPEEIKNALIFGMGYTSWQLKEMEVTGIDGDLVKKVFDLL